MWSLQDALLGLALINLYLYFSLHKDDDFDFSIDLSLISNVESDPFCGTKNDDAIEHMNKLASLSLLFSDDKKIQRYWYVSNISIIF